jgi:hypothetical protein
MLKGKAVSLLEDETMLAPVPGILSYEAFGKLIEKWTLDETSRPQSFAEFKQQVAGIIRLPLPDWIKDFELVYSEDKLLIRLPPKAVLQEALAAIKGGQPYPLPAFYERRIVDGDPPDTPEGNERLFFMRMGDYTITYCG